MIAPGDQDDASKAKLRRRLVQQWASMSQKERDTFQSRAPARKHCSWYPRQLNGAKRRTIGISHLTVPQPMDARNRALWTKLRIMLYHLDGEDGYLFDYADGEPSITEPNPVNPDPVTPDNFFRCCYLESADFDYMAMTSIGTVICHNYQDNILLADQEALDTGLMMLCRMENNGQVGCSGRIWPVMMGNTYLGTQRAVDEILKKDMFSQNLLRWMR